jgi:CRP-like cAMP-binding protein
MIYLTQGEFDSYLYMVEKGTLKVTVQNSDVARIQPGTVFGEIAFLYGTQRSATITTVETCELWRIDR